MQRSSKKQFKSSCLRVPMGFNYMLPQLFNDTKLFWTLLTPNSLLSQFMFQYVLCKCLFVAPRGHSPCIEFPVVSYQGNNFLTV